MPRIVTQIREALDAFAVCRIPPALIGGLALAAHRVVRATQDVDFLVDAADADRIDEAITALGYACIHRSADAANYARGDERLDLIYAHRPRAVQLLAAAAERETSFGRIRVVSVEGLIGFKLQGYLNDPQRTQDLEDIRALMRVHRGQLDMDETRAYFALFDREDLLDELIAETR